MKWLERGLWTLILMLAAATVFSAYKDPPPTIWELEHRIAAIEERLDQTELVVSALRDYLARHPVDSTPAGDPRPTLKDSDGR